MNSDRRVKPEDWFATYHHLGSHYPYYLREEKPFKFYTQISSALERLQTKKRQIDPVGIIEFIATSFLLGNRTLVRGLRRAPWMGCPNGSEFEYSPVQDHGQLKTTVEQTVIDLKAALKQEALQYVNGRNTVGILLSGGLDSRIVAGILKELQLTGDFPGDVIALTWGLPDCRDVIYAREIVKRYHWEWLHFPLTPELLAKNIYISGSLGAEFSPFHLHALPEVRRTEGIDAIIAGSYGDGVGRAEFSGRHVLKLKPIIPRRFDRFGIIKHGVVRAHRDIVVNDACGYRKYVRRQASYQYLELEQQMHYMRRKLQACMSYVAERTPVYQFFTAPDTVKVMWSIDVSLRGNCIYQGLLPTLPKNIGGLPWARTGRSLGNRGPSDHAAKLHHQYGLWLRRDLKSLIKSLVLSDPIKTLNIFNISTINRLLKVWPSSNTVTTNNIDEVVSWLASLAVFVKDYSIQPSKLMQANLRDRLSTFCGYVNAKTYLIVRERLRS